MTFKPGDMVQVAADEDSDLRSYHGEVGQLVGIFPKTGQVYFERQDAFVNFPWAQIRHYRTGPVDTRGRFEMRQNNA